MPHPRAKVTLPQGSFLQGYRDAWARKEIRYPDPEYMRGFRDGEADRRIADREMNRPLDTQVRVKPSATSRQQFNGFFSPNGAKLERKTA